MSRATLSPAPALALARFGLLALRELSDANGGRGLRREIGEVPLLVARSPARQARPEVDGADQLPLITSGSTSLTPRRATPPTPATSVGLLHVHHAARVLRSWSMDRRARSPPAAARSAWPRNLGSRALAAPPRPDPSFRSRSLGRHHDPRFESDLRLECVSTPDRTASDGPPGRWSDRRRAAPRPAGVPPHAARMWRASVARAERRTRPWRHGLVVDRLEPMAPRRTARTRVASCESRPMHRWPPPPNGKEASRGRAGPAGRRNRSVSKSSGLGPGPASGGPPTGSPRHGAYRHGVTQHDIVRARAARRDPRRRFRRSVSSSTART